MLFDKGSSVTLMDLARAATGLARVVFVLEPRWSDDPLVLRGLAKLGGVVVEERDAWGVRLHSEQLSGIVTFNDEYVEDVDRHARRLGLRGSAGTGAWDKHQQREALDAAGASDVGTSAIASVEDLNLARERHGSRGVIKPRRGSGSRGIVVVDASASTADTWAALPDTENLTYEGFIPALVRPDGLAPFVSVDTVSVGNRRHHFGMFDKLPLVRQALETGDIGPCALTAHQRIQVLEVVDRALDCLSIRDRVTHTEVRLSPGNPQVVEVNGRLGGYVQRLAQRTSGVDACRLSLKAALGHWGDETVISSKGRESATATGLLLLPLDHAEDQVVRHVEREMRRHPGVFAVEAVAPISASFRSAACWISEADPDSTRQRLADIATGLAEEPIVAQHVDADWLESMSVLRSESD